MIEIQSELLIYLAGFAIVLLLVVGRLFVGEHYFNDRGRFWGPIRRAFIPWLHRRFQDVDDYFYAETEVEKDQLVGVVDESPDAVIDELDAAGYEPQPLASLATDWTGRTELASWARYYGSKPFRGAPEFFRPRQVHVRLFERDGGTAIVAHEESTPWRPDLWRDHYGAHSLDVERGRELAADDLGLVEPSRAPSEAVQPAPN